ncbi:MAG: hypothetical protein WD696_11965 [Bryobacteraceae bacterium]
MPGLLDSLNDLFGGSGLSAQISVQVDGLDTVTSAVQALIAGPSALADLEASAGSLPSPPGLGGIGNLAASLGSLQLPTDLSSVLAPILTPLTGLNLQVTASASATVAAVGLIREIVAFATGRPIGGPSGMPAEAPAFSLQDLPSPEEMHALFGPANEFIDRLGPRIDAARILELLQQAARAFRKPNFMAPPIPFLDDLMEALATVAAWQTMTGEELTAHLARTLSRVAQLMATPRQLVAQPILDAAAVVAGGPASVAALQRDLPPVVASLRRKITGGGSQPNTSEVVAVENAAALFKRLADAVDPTASPLARWDLADERLTRQLLVVIRALEPGYSLGAAGPTMRAVIEEIPAVPSAVFDGVVAEIDDFNLSALIDPIQAVTEAVQTAVDEVNAAKESVRAALVSALAPVADALDAALAAAGFQEIAAALEALPAQIQQFVDSQIAPNLESVRNAVGDAVDTVSNAADQFNPEALIDPIRQVVEDAAALLQTEEIRSLFADLQRVLDSALSALENLDLSIAADASVDLIGGIEEKIAAIDPASIPDASKPLLSQAVQVVTNIDFTAEVGGPLLTRIEEAAQRGPATVLDALEASMDSFRASVENFKPSVAIGAQLDKPFRQLTDTLRQFQPSDLLNRLQEALDQLAGRLQVLDVGAVVDPLIGLHAGITAQIEAARPSNLLQPVNDAIAAAIEKVFQASGLDTIFAGINEIMDVIRTWTGLLADARDLLNRVAALLDQPGDAAASVQQLTDDVLAKLDSVDMSGLQAAFSATAAAAASIERDALARDVANAFQAAGRAGPGLLASSDLSALIQMGRAFPLDELRANRPTPARQRLIAAVVLWQACADRIEAARPRWVHIGPELEGAAGDVQERLLDYYRVTRIQADSLFAEFLNPPRTTAELKEAVRRALSDALTEPLTVVILGFQALSPYVRMAADGIARVLGALHAKIDSLVGAGGVGGTVDALNEAADLLRGIDLQPITQPLDELFARIEAAAEAVNPEPLRAALIAARDAITNLLSVTSLINQEDIDALDQAYAQALAKIEGLSPSVLIGQTLDPVFEDLMADFLVVLDLPLQLRVRIEAAGRDLREEATRELARVEAAFDSMLQAIPLDGGASASVSVSGSVSVG